MGVILAIGQHNKITAKEKIKICDCWFSEGNEPVKRGECKNEGCFLDREEKWRRMPTEEQKADDDRRGQYAKEVVKTIKETLECLEKVKELKGRD
jgi:hypothetical protein